MIRRFLNAQNGLQPNGFQFNGLKCFWLKKKSSGIFFFNQSSSSLDFQTMRFCSDIFLIRVSIIASNLWSKPNQTLKICNCNKCQSSKPWVCSPQKRHRKCDRQFPRESVNFMAYFALFIGFMICTRFEDVYWYHFTTLNPIYV